MILLSSRHYGPPVFFKGESGNDFRLQVEIFYLHSLSSIWSKMDNFSAHWKANDKRTLKHPQHLILESF